MMTSDNGSPDSIDRWLERTLVLVGELARRETAAQIAAELRPGSLAPHVFETPCFIDELPADEPLPDWYCVCGRSRDDDCQPATGRGHAPQLLAGATFEQPADFLSGQAAGDELDNDNEVGDA